MAPVAVSEQGAIDITSPTLTPSPQPTTSERTAGPESFARLGIAPQVLGAIHHLGYTEPTPIQQQAIPIMLSGCDLVGQAQTGTGKTLVFGVAIAQGIEPGVEGTQALVLAPTRELAKQVTGVLHSIAGSRGLRIVSLVGGHKMQTDFDALRHPPHIVVGTPGRVADHLERRTLVLDGVRIAILDEADQMLDIGFAPAIERILAYTPRERQTALFSATMPPFIRRMIRRHMREPQWVQIAPDELTVDAIEQVYYEVSERDKLAGLCELLASDGMRRTLVFRRTQIGVDRLQQGLRRRGIQASAIHGGMEQPKREKVLAAFRSGEAPVLIATNVASRGLDIDDVTHVVNYDIPQNVEEYIHRIGRTGRAGRAGVAVSFVGEWELNEFAELQERFGDSLQPRRLALYGG